MLRIISLCFFMWFVASQEPETMPRAEFMTKEEMPDVAQKHFEKYDTALAEAYFEPFVKELLFHTFEARIRLQRGMEECYFEECDRNTTTVRLSFQSNTPSSFTSKGNLMAYIRALNGSVFPATEEPAKEGDVTVQCSDVGLYEFCLDNRDDRFSEKSVDIQIMVYRSGQQMGLHAHHIYMTNETDYRLYNHFFKVLHAIWRSSLSVHSRKAHIVRDYELTQSNQRMVTSFSFFSMVLVLFVSYGQVYYLKRMFNYGERPLNANGATRL